MFPIRDHNPSGRVPYVTWGLMATNILIFLSYLAIMNDGRALSLFYYNWAFIPARFSSGENASALISSMFLHASWMHLIGNMLFLFIFGDNIEDEMGHIPFFAFYIASGIVAAIVQYLAEPASAVPMVGASGAIAGVMGAYLLMFPKARVDIFLFFIIIFRIIPVPAWVMLGLWFAFQFVGGIGANAGGGGVAYWAHAGGFVAGLILALPLWLKRGGPQFWTRTHGHPPHPETRYSTSRLPKIRR